MEAIESVLRPKFLPYTIVEAVNDACDSLISIINVRRQELIDLIKVREQEMADIKICKDRAHLEFFEADRLYDTCSSPWYKYKIPASFEEILHKSVYIKERRAYGEFKLSVKCDKEPFRTIVKQITDVYLEVVNPEIMKYQHDTPQEHAIIGIGARGSSIGEYNYPTDIAYDETTEELFIADRDNNRIVVCNVTGDYLRHLDGRDVMNLPYSIAIAPELIYIGTADDNLFKYSRNTYQLLNQAKLVSGKYTSILSCLAIHANTNLYVSDVYSSSRIFIYNEDLVFIQHFTHPLLNSVTGLILTDDRMYVLVAGKGNHCVLIFSAAHPHIYIKSIISRSEVKSGFYFCVDGHNNFLISDCNSCNIMIFSPHGKLLNVIGKYGKQRKGELNDLAGICVTNQDSIICVNNHDKYCIQIFY